MMAMVMGRGGMMAMMGCWRCQANHKRRTSRSRWKGVWRYAPHSLKGRKNQEEDASGYTKRRQPENNCASHDTTGGVFINKSNARDLPACKGLEGSGKQKKNNRVRSIASLPAHPPPPSPPPTPCSSNLFLKDLYCLLGQGCGQTPACDFRHAVRKELWPCHAKQARCGVFTD